MNDIMNTILKRRSVRKYTQQPVEKEKLILLLQAAMAAPTACNNQPWEFIVVNTPEKMVELRHNLQYGKYNAPAAIVPCHNPKIGKSPSCDQFWVQDLSASIESLMIAAVGLDLGTVWLGVYPTVETIAKVSTVLAIPEGVTPLAVIYVGYPAEDKPARTQYDSKQVHWNSY
jgi:nitroreductase